MHTLLRPLFRRVFRRHVTVKRTKHIVSSSHLVSANGHSVNKNINKHKPTGVCIYVALGHGDRRCGRSSMLRLIHGFDGNMNCSGLTGVNRFIRGQKRNCSPCWRRYSEELSVEILMFAAAGGSGAGAELRGRFVRHGAISRRREWGQRRRGGVSLPNPDSGADRRWAIHLEFTVCAASICSSPRGCSSCSCGSFVGFSIRRVPSFSHWASTQ